MPKYVGDNANLGWHRPDQPAGFIASILGAMLLLIYRMAIGRRAYPRV